MSWFINDIEAAINHWIGLCRGEIKDDSFLGIDFVAPVILAKADNKIVTQKVVGILDEFIAVSVDWTIKILSAMEGNGFIF